MNQICPPVIIGGGLAGLSALYHYPEVASLYERSSVLGGTAGSYKVGDFTFDHTGHLLHLHNDYTKKLIPELLKDNLVERKRNAWIFSNGTYTRYPFQANLYGLPKEVIDSCLDGLAEVKDLPVPSTTASFAEWAKSLYGKGIFEHFMEPYNRKLYGTTTDMTAEWCGQFVPRVSFEEAQRGATEDMTTAHGYNTSFFYPKEGGIQVLSEALAAPKRHRIHLESEMESVYWRSRIVAFKRANQVIDTHYSKLVVTIPLPELLKRLDPFPEELREPMSHLQVRPITCVNIGVKRPNISDKSWVYFPEDKYIFYRAGFPASFTPNVVPEGCSSVYVEIGGENKDPKLLYRVLADLKDAGILVAGDEVVAHSILPIKYAYVLYTPGRTKAMEQITDWLNKRHIYLVGRYAKMQYGFMEQAILEGKAVAEQMVKEIPHKVIWRKHRV